MPLDEELLRAARRARERLVELEGELGHARVDYHQSIRTLHAAGGSLREIAEALGLSHQRVHQIVEGEVAPGFDFRRMPSGWRLREKGGARDRFRADAAAAVVRARALARELGHGQIGTQHLLLALLEVRGSVAARALRAAGLKAQRLRAEVARQAGEGVGGLVAESLLPFTDESKTAFERALRESLARGQAQIGTENILMGLLEEPKGAAFQALTALRIDIAQLSSQFEQKPPLPGYRRGA